MTDNQVIPEAAVEAAAKKLAILNSDAGDQLTDHEWARHLLEAAAPHLMAKAWDEGHESGYAEGADVDLMVQAADNPYRTAK